MLGSIEASTMSRMHLVGRSCPMRQMRPTACCSMPGCKLGSSSTATLATCRLSPAAPEPPAPEEPAKRGTRSATHGVAGIPAAPPAAPLTAPSAAPPAAPPEVSALPPSPPWSAARQPSSALVLAPAWHAGGLALLGAPAVAPESASKRRSASCLAPTEPTSDAQPRRCAVSAAAASASSLVHAEKTTTFSPRDAAWPASGWTT
eukprot:scaffold82017_cov49-Phaeocystis_antarctica.AAC.2